MNNEKTLILTDNKYALELANELLDKYGSIDIRQSPTGTLDDAPRIDVKQDLPHIVRSYGLVISIHSKQLFPPELVNAVRCINVHPGLNPYNRGWFPQVFSIINGLPAGVTIHEMDEQLDHGPVILQQEVAIESWDTSESVYLKIMRLERELVLENFTRIRDRDYRTQRVEVGNINLKIDFDQLKEIDLAEQGSFGSFLDRLRALTHSPYRNAFFIDESGNKVYVDIVLHSESISKRPK